MREVIGMRRLVSRDDVALEHGVPCALLVIDFLDDLILVRSLRDGVDDLAAVVLSRRQPRCDVHGRLAVERRINAVVRERRCQIELPARIALRRSKCRPVAGHHCFCRDKREGVSAAAARYCALVAAEEEQLVTDNRPTKRPPVLIPLQRAVHSLACFRIHRRKIRCSVEQIVAHELERIAVELVRSGLRHRTNLGTRGQTLRGRQATGLHLKLLERVRKWKGQTQIVIPIGMQRAIQRIGDTTRETASHSNVRLVLHAST